MIYIILPPLSVSSILRYGFSELFSRCFAAIMMRASLRRILISSSISAPPFRRDAEAYSRFTMSRRCRLLVYFRAAEMVSRQLDFSPLPLEPAPQLPLRRQPMPLRLRVQSDAFSSPQLSVRQSLPLFIFVSFHSVLPFSPFTTDFLLFATLSPRIS